MNSKISQGFNFESKSFTPDDNVMKYYYNPKENTFHACARDVESFSIGDSVIVHDGSYNCDLNRVHRYGVDPLFTNQAIILHSELKNKWTCYRVTNEHWVIVRLDLHLKFDDPDQTEIYCSSLCVKKL